MRLYRSFRGVFAFLTAKVRTLVLKAWNGFLPQNMFIDNGLPDREAACLLSFAGPKKMEFV